MGLRAKFGGGKCLPRGPCSGISLAARAVSVPACRGGPYKQVEALGLTAFGFLRTSPYRSKLLTALHEKSPARCAELQIVCGERGILARAPPARRREKARTAWLIPCGERKGKDNLQPPPTSDTPPHPGRAAESYRLSSFNSYKACAYGRMLCCLKKYGRDVALRQAALSSQA